MVNTKTLEKDIDKELKEVFLGLEYEEIVAYYKAMNKKIIETYPSSNSHEWNVEEHNKLFDNIEEATDIIKAKYPLINVVKLATRFEELKSKYLNEHDIAYYNKLTDSLVLIATIISYSLKNIKFFLSGLYTYLDYVKGIGTSIIVEELGLTYEDVEPIEEAFYNKENPSYYGITAHRYINYFIKSEVETIEEYISFFRKYFIKYTYNPEELSEELLEVVESYIEIYDSCLGYIEEYEELKLNPFKEAIRINVKAMKEVDSKAKFSFNHDYKAIYESKLANAPTYNFKEFKLELNRS